MAFFKINYNRPGPGVGKNEPKKKSFFLFWELYARKFWKLVIANLLYVLVSVPIVTTGLAQAGLTYVTRSYCREKHVFLPSDFFDTIKKNWKQALPVGILELVIGTLLISDMYYFWGNLMQVEKLSFLPILLFAVSSFLLVIFFFARYYLYLQMITFRFSFGQLIKNSVLFAMVGLKQNLLISVVLAILYGLAGMALGYLFNYALPLVILIYLFLFPAFRSFLIQFTVFPLVKKAVIDPYYAAHPQEDLEARRNLNLEDVPEDGQPEETLFTDTGKTASTTISESEGSPIPKQYDAEELRRAKRLQKLKSASDEDEDGTI